MAYKKHLCKYSRHHIRSKMLVFIISTLLVLSTTTVDSLPAPPKIPHRGIPLSKALLFYYVTELEAHELRHELHHLKPEDFPTKEAYEKEMSAIHKNINNLHHLALEPPALMDVDAFVKDTEFLEHVKQEEFVHDIRVEHEHDTKQHVPFSI